MAVGARIFATPSIAEIFCQHRCGVNRRVHGRIKEKGHREPFDCSAICLGYPVFGCPNLIVCDELAEFTHLKHEDIRIGGRHFFEHPVGSGFDVKARFLGFIDWLALFKIECRQQGCEQPMIKMGATPKWILCYALAAFSIVKQSSQFQGRPRDKYLFLPRSSQFFPS